MSIWDDYRNNICPNYQKIIMNIGTSISQSASTWLLGDPDETISSRVGKAERAGKPLFVNVISPLLDVLTLETNHAYKSIEDDEGDKAIWDWSV